MSKADDIFWRQFGAILIILIVFTIVVFFTARSIAGDSHTAALSSPAAVESRIAPVAKVRVGDPNKTVEAEKPAAPVVAAAPAASAASADGESVYAGACVACHASGVAGAPKFGDAAAWEPRVATGEDALVASALNGKGAMPPKGGNPALTEEQIRAAVKHMVKAAGG